MTTRKQRLTFIICTYALFWILILLIGVVIMTGLLPSEGAPMQLMVAVASWTPTIVLLILYRKINPGSTLKQFYKNAFKERINWKLIIVVTIVQLLVFIGAVSFVAITKEVSFDSILDLSISTLLLGFVWSLIQGATGEESGWRGFLQPSLEINNSVIKSSLITGIIWGFWHTPLWLMEGYNAIQLLTYIVGFLLSITSVSIIIGICYSRCKNLFVPMWIHFMFNFVLTVFTGNVLDLFIALVVLYIFAAAGYVIWHKRQVGNGFPAK